MHASLTRATVTDHVPEEFASLLGEEMTRWLQDIDGFLGLILISRPGETIGLSFWDSRETANAHRPARRQFIERMTGTVGVQVDEIVDYDVSFAEVQALHARTSGDTSAS